MKKAILLLSILLTACLTLQSQVTIGTDEKPASGSLLHLKTIKGVDSNTFNSTKGLGLPRVTLTNLSPTTGVELATSIGNVGDWNMDAHIGLVVYAVSIENCSYKGFYVWDGASWASLAGDNSKVYTRQTDSLALVALYNSTNGANWIKKRIGLVISQWINGKESH